MDDTKSVVRVLMVIILLGCAIISKLITKIIGNSRLSRLADSLFKVLIIVVIFKALSAWLDTLVLPEFAIFSTLASLVSYFFIFLLLLKLYISLKLRENELNKTEGSILYYKRLDKKKLSTLIDGVFDELRSNQNKTEMLHISIKNDLRNYDGI